VRPCCVSDRTRCELSRGLQPDGLQVAPAQLEALLLAHPAVADAVVIIPALMSRPAKSPNPFWYKTGPTRQQPPIQNKYRHGWPTRWHRTNASDAMSSLTWSRVLCPANIRRRLIERERTLQHTTAPVQ
jgi:hypothetical protein